MKLKKYKVILLLITSIIINQNIAIAKEKVVVTIKPIHSLVQGVMGESGEAILLLKGKRSPHDVLLKPSQIKVMQEADIIFFVSTNLEMFIERTFKIIPEKVQKIALFNLKELKLHKYRKYDHDSSEHSHKHEDDMHSDYDLHIWLNPDNAIIITKAIEKQLSKKYPYHKSIYRNNMAKIIKKIELLNIKIKKNFKNVNKRRFWVFHDAYQYFEKYYGITNLGAITKEPEVPPSIKRISEIRNHINKSQINCVFKEPFSPDKFIDLIKEGNERRIRIGQLDPIGIEVAPGSELYFLLMENMAQSFNECFK